MIYELDQIGQNLDIDLEKKTQRKDQLTIGESSKRKPTQSYREESGEVNPIPGNQPECGSGTSKNITPIRVENPSPPSCSSNVNIKMSYKPWDETADVEEEHSG